MEVGIIEKATGKVVATITVIEVGLNYAPNEEEHYKDAWQSAVEDGLVDEANPDAYKFVIWSSG